MLEAVSMHSDRPAVPRPARGAIRLIDVTKTYGSLKVLDRISLSVEAGEFVALLGPSGSGKSTLLMTLAGFESPSAGDILVDGISVVRQPAHARGFGIVFQRYALFPHMTVAENVAYPLRRRDVRGPALDRDVAKALELVDLGGHGWKLPSQLSGGQQQRVALARALVFKPPLLLMDEPLGALDRKLRQQLQIEIKLIHRQVGCTIVFVTHDQEEAMSMADRIAILDGGYVQQFDTPRNLYDRPCNAFVADFIGENTFIQVDLRRSGDAVHVRNRELGVDAVLASRQVMTGGQTGRLAVRPENVQLRRTPGGMAEVVEVAYAGSNQIVLIQAGSSRLLARVPLEVGVPLLAPADQVDVHVDAAGLAVFD